MSPYDVKNEWGIQMICWNGIERNGQNMVVLLCHKPILGSLKLFKKIKNERKINGQERVNRRLKDQIKTIGQGCEPNCNNGWSN